MAATFIDEGLTAEQLRALLHYNPLTGKFRWRRDADHWRAGLLAGTEAAMGLQQYKRPYVVMGIGYRSKRLRTLIGIHYRNYRAHRLAWLYVYGEWPKGYIDHINGDGTDNRIANLRLCTQTQNAGNTKKPKHNTSGFKGAYLEKRTGRWYGKIMFQRKAHYLGTFDTPKEAHAAYCEAAKRLYGEFARFK